MREVDDTCSAVLRDGLLAVNVPGCRITHRLQLDTAWMRALEGALQFVCQCNASTMAELGARLNVHLDLLDLKLSRFERKIIYMHAMGGTEC